MKQNKVKNNAFGCSLKIWTCEFFNMIVFILLAFIIFFIAKLFLGYNTLKLYNNYIKVFIIILAYIGIFLGAHNSFKKINKNKSYLSKGTKFLVLLYQIVLVLIYSYICFINKYDVILFLGGYLSLYIQFLFNTIYTSVNNKKYPFEKRKDDDNTRTRTNNKDMIIDVSKLK